MENHSRPQKSGTSCTGRVGLAGRVQITGGRLVTTLAAPFNGTVYKLGDKYLAARNNEFGFANYEVEEIKREASSAAGCASRCFIFCLSVRCCSWFMQSGVISAQPGSKRIDSHPTICNRYRSVLAAQWKRQPTAEELAGLVESRVRDEILYREALAMGLDKDDEIVKRRMAQKMQFLAEDLPAPQPTTAELKSGSRRTRNFEVPQGQLSPPLFLPDRRGQRAHADVIAHWRSLSVNPRIRQCAVALGIGSCFRNTTATAE